MNYDIYTCVRYYLDMNTIENHKDNFNVSVTFILLFFLVFRYILLQNEVIPLGKVHKCSRFERLLVYTKRIEI